MDKKAATSRLNKEETVQQLIEKHGKFIEKLREVKVRNPVRFPCRDMVMGRLSNGNGNGREDVTQEVNSCFFKLHCSYPSSFNLSNDGYFFFQELNSKGLYVSSPKKKENRCLVFRCVHVLHKAWNWEGSRRSCEMTAKKCTKTRDTRAKLLFCQSKPIAFSPSSLMSPSSFLKVPGDATWLKHFLFIVRNTEALVKGSEESAIVACLNSRSCVMFCMGKSFLFLSILTVKALKVFWCDFRLSLFCVQWLSCATDTPTLHIKCG